MVRATGTGAGPLKPTVVTIRGSHLDGATAVRFGSRKGTIIRVVGSTAIEVRTPRGARAGTVSVQVRAHGSWSKKSSRARYSFVAAPKLSKLSPTSGSYHGGQRVTLRGSNLTRTVRVRFGSAKATIVSRKKDRVVVKAPIGVLGSARVTVTTPGGSSRSKSYTYTKPAAKSVTKVTTLPGTAKPSAVEWVTGGYNPDTGKAEPWVVGLPQRATVPAVGKPFLVKPGTRVFPSGLVGTVTDVAVQADETVRVTVAPKALETSLEGLQVNYSGPLRTTNARQGRNASEVGNSTTFSIKGPTSLFCTSPTGASVSVGADLSMSISDVDVSQHFDSGHLWHRPTYDGSFTAEVKTTGKISVAAAATCKLRPEWQKAQRRIIPLGASGATVSFGPSMAFKVTSKGTWSVVDRTRTTFAVSAKLGSTPEFSKTSRSVESKQGGALSFSLEVTAGVSVQFGLLDTAGLEAKVLLGASVTVTDTRDNACVDGSLFLRLTVGVFLDAIVARWERQVFTGTLELARVHRCALPEGSAPPGEPGITSARLPDAQIGAGYQATLTTADHRNGTWSLVSQALPAGLTLDRASGSISGTPVGPVGDYPVLVDFTDTDHQVATTTIRIRIQPSRGIGGGDIQVTLRWTGPADLDLHVVDPAGEEIYYSHRYSASGGTLDHDANAGCNGLADDDNAVENVFWPPHQAPAGSYTTWVHVWAVCGGPLDWHLTVRRNGVVIVDQTGSGESPGYTFGVGTGAGVRVGRQPKVTTHYPAK
ncbi:IPT/TIG domain-containing protein [uncultured Friedmanniella sp.]|uniref:IPT/TIG domain-containing protein n=1 Tax=uncultured Friedmanniella sp. TaxID=335381 RepID=UPI0035CC6BDA